MRVKPFLLAGSVLLALSAVPSAFAGAVGTYTFTGTMSGTIGSAPFSNASFTVTASGPISAVVTFSEGYELFFAPGSMSFTISGIGSGTFTGLDDTYVFDNTTQGLAGFGDQSDPVYCCDLLDINQGVIGSTAFSTYNLQSSLGPLGLWPSGSSVDWDQVPTSLGAFTVTSYDNVSFQATVGATPEPGTLLLLASGLPAIGFLCRKFARA